MHMKQPFQGKIINTRKKEISIILRSIAEYFPQKERTSLTDCHK
jgi:hypothetical protein